MLFTPQVCSVGLVAAPLGAVCVLELLVLPQELPGQWPWKNSRDFLPSFSGPLLGQAVVAGKQGFILPLQAGAGRTWLSWKSRKRQHQFPWAAG